MSRLNRWLAARITRAVGTMWCAYAFAALALLGLPAAIRPGGVGFIVWLSTAFLQLVLLSILAVGQQVQAERTTAVHDRLDAHAERLDAIHTHITQPRTGRQRKEIAP